MCKTAEFKLPDRAHDSSNTLLSLTWQMYSLESIFSGFSQHDEDKQSDFSVEGERHNFVQHDDKTLKENTGDRQNSTYFSSIWALHHHHHHHYSSVSSIITINWCVCVCDCLIYPGITGWHDEDDTESKQWHESFSQAGRQRRGAWFIRHAPRQKINCRLNNKAGRTESQL